MKCDKTTKNELNELGKLIDFTESMNDEEIEANINLPRVRKLYDKLSKRCG
jgi:hypothetical protein